MKRFVYTPVLEAYCLSSDKGKLFDLTNDIVSGSVTRNINAVSTCNFVLQNRRNKYTGVFKPMDRIIVYQGRVNKMLTFSGYLDSATYYQIYPDTAQLAASCPFKLVQNLYFDPGIAEVWKFFAEFGWNWDPTKGILNMGDDEIFGDFEPEGGLGDVIRAMLTEIGGLDDSQILIGNMSQATIDAYAAFYDKIKKDEVTRFKNIDKLIHAITKVREESGDLTGVGGGGSGDVGDPGGGGGGGGAGATGSVSAEKKDIICAIIKAAEKAGLNPEIELAVALVESNLNASAEGDGGCSHGLYQFNQCGGAGSGHSTANLNDPAYNINLAMNLHTGAMKSCSGSAENRIVRCGQRPAEQDAYIALISPGGSRRNEAKALIAATNCNQSGTTSGQQGGGGNTGPGGGGGGGGGGGAN